MDKQDIWNLFIKHGVDMSMKGNQELVNIIAVKLADQLQQQEVSENDKIPESEFYRVEPDEWQMPFMKGYRMSCCDCGLVHRIDFKVIDENDHDKEIKGVRVLMKANRED